MRRAAKVDLNQKQIVRELRALGFSVRHTHTIGQGFPDLVIGKRGVNLLVEVKRDNEPLTVDELDFFATWNGSVIIGYSAEQIQRDFDKKG